MYLDNNIYLCFRLNRFILFHNNQHTPYYYNSCLLLRLNRKCCARIEVLGEGREKKVNMIYFNRLTGAVLKACQIHCYLPEKGKVKVLSKQEGNALDFITGEHHGSYVDIKYFDRYYSFFLRDPIDFTIDLESSMKVEVRLVHYPKDNSVDISITLNGTTKTLHLKEK